MFSQTRSPSFRAQSRNPCGASSSTAAWIAASCDFAQDDALRSAQNDEFDSCTSKLGLYLQWKIIANTDQLWAMSY